jgi:hypothetical protein
MQTSLAENSAEADQASILRLSGLKTEREVLEFAAWLNTRLPKVQSEEINRDFLLTVRMTAPNLATLETKKSELEKRRGLLEAELASIPNVSARLLALANERKHQELKPEDAKLFRSAQYLASLRLTLKMLAALESR